MAAFLSVSELCFRLNNGSPLFQNISFTAQQGLIAIVGANGVGKSVLGRCVGGLLSIDSGSIQHKGHIHYVAQNGPASISVLAIDLFSLRAGYVAAQNIEAGADSPELLTQALHWWEHSAELYKQLRTVGLPEETDLMRPVSSFSGGEQFRLMWAAALLEKPDVFIFDEPSNHLDRLGRQNFISWLETEKRPRIIISHDRELLNRADQILELTPHQMHTHPGSYQDYLEQRNQRWDHQQQHLSEARRHKKHQQQAAQAALEKQQQRASRGKVTANKTGLDTLVRNAMKQAAENSQGQQKLLRQNRKDSAVQAFHNAESEREWSDPINFDLAGSKLPAGKTVLSITDMCSGVIQPHHPPLTLQLKGAFRLSIEGPNGAGKSVLLKTLLQLLPPLQGYCEQHVPVAHLDQHFHHYDQQRSAIDNLLNQQPKLTVQEGRECLARVRLRNDKADIPFGRLSGGEQLKAVLATELLGPVTPQLLLLDEPTNHMDLDSVLALEQALAQYQGALIVISHDFNFVKSLKLTHRLSLPKAELVQL